MYARVFGFNIKSDTVLGGDDFAERLGLIDVYCAGRCSSSPHGYPDNYRILRYGGEEETES